MGNLEVVPITQIPNEAWCEGLCAQPDNRVLAARLDAPEIFEIDPTDADSTPQKVCRLPGTAATLDLCAVPGREGEYSVISADVSDLAACRWADFAVWHLKLVPGAAAVATRKGSITEIQLPLGISPIPTSTRHILVADSGKACIQCLDVTNGRSAVLLSHPATMAVVDSPDEFFGVNRICLTDTHVWYSNLSAGTLHRVSIAWEDDGDGDKPPLRITGTPEKMADGLEHCNGFQLSPDATAAYTVNDLEGKLVRTDLAGASVGSVRQSVPVKTNLVSPTAVQIGRRPLPSGKMPLFVVCCGEIDVGWLSNTVSWKDIADISATRTVVVTEEAL